MKTSLLARFAENIFWLARYMERAENLARILEVMETHARDDKGNQDWAAILEMNADMEWFREGYDAADGPVGGRFYLLDRTTRPRSSRPSPWPARTPVPCAI